MSSGFTLWQRFLEPGPEWRGKPFWSWNGELEETELRRQTHVMAQMGLGGWFMHARTGLATEYLGPEWFALTNACADEGARLGLESWLYDEDRWPSGTAGGMVTADPRFRARFVSLRRADPGEFAWHDDLLAAFAVDLDGLSYTHAVRLGPDSPPASFADRTVLAFYVEEMEPSSFYNGHTYVDTLQRAATERYLELTHEQYALHCGERLGASIRGIFTDEPHRGPVMCGFGLSNHNRLAMAPWTADLPARFLERFGYDLVDRLPELFLQPDGEAVRQVKWHYMELLQALFLSEFLAPLHAWCDAHGMALTGHLLHEDSLTSQSAMQGSLMRAYEWLHVPGVDVLTEGNRAFWIVKQLASAARQLGRRWLLSELYGCTGWQMTFAGHKAVGDWQALFGINLRCHHLAWYTMAGEAKRDYPASILHQSAWWRDYHVVETYFARLAQMLDHGRPCCDLLVLNPVESVWCQVHVGWAEGLASRVPEIVALERAHAELFHWLAGAQLDFDYGDEEMLGRLASVETAADGSPRLRVGQAAYRGVLVPRLTTIRATSLALLEQFAAAGGLVVFAGEPPEYVDALPSSAAAALALGCAQVPWQPAPIVAAAKRACVHRVEVLDPRDGAHVPTVFCQMRLAGDQPCVVALNVDREQGLDQVVVRVRTDYQQVAEWDCLHARRYAVPARSEGGWLEFVTSFAPGGERVFVVGPECADGLALRSERSTAPTRPVTGPCEYELSEPNVLVLDQPRWRLDDGPWQPALEILKVDRAVRAACGLPARGGEMVQPWFRHRCGVPPVVHGTVTLAYDLAVETLPDGPVALALERPTRWTLQVNGTPVGTTPDGWWCDRAFEQVWLPAGLLRVGANELVLSAAFDDELDLEAVYLLGGFGVRLADGRTPVVTALPERLALSDLAGQGLPFYGGAVTYCFTLDAPGSFLRVPACEAACVKVRSGGAERVLPWHPYEAELDGPAVELEVVLTRRNTFGPLHQVPPRASGYGPGNWVTSGDGWSDAYQLWPSGLQAPVEVG